MKREPNTNHKNNSFSAANTIPSRSTSPTNSFSFGPQLQACAACKYQRRRCSPNCPLAPYFPSNQQREFLNAHKLFGVSNILKITKNLDPQRKQVAMSTMKFEAKVRANDPVGGCYRMIIELQNQIAYNKAELQLVLHQIALCQAAASSPALQVTSSPSPAIYGPPQPIDPNPNPNPNPNPSNNTYNSMSSDMSNLHTQNQQSSTLEVEEKNYSMSSDMSNLHAQNQQSSTLEVEEKNYSMSSDMSNLHVQNQQSSNSEHPLPQGEVKKNYGFQECGSVTVDMEGSSSSCFSIAK
ncbi:putative LOB domain-containing protein [Quillaja saponaria]|uniref:LOB domain-containing protein n=1 Tax=Quillaja saponaria TaxID=32244 RepID=A0AAD7PJY0_QUISA|nr:putative LOB domain-containing protein [Quillaja saponaria]